MVKCSVNIGQRVTYDGVNYVAGNILEMKSADAAKAEKENKVTILKTPAKKEGEKCLSKEEK